MPIRQKSGGAQELAAYSWKNPALLAGGLLCGLFLSAASLLQQHSGSLLSALMGDGREAEIIVQQPQQPETPNQFLNPDGQNRQQHQQQQQQHRPKGTTEDFLQQLRLGLVDAGAQVD